MQPNNSSLLDLIMFNVKICALHDICKIRALNYGTQLRHSITALNHGTQLWHSIMVVNYGTQTQITAL